MNLKLLSWNVRGLNNPQKRVIAKNLLAEWKCDVVCLQETKLDSINSTGVMNLWGSRFVVWVALDANHTTGGVLSIWDRRMFEKVDCVVGRFSIFVYIECFHCLLFQVMLFLASSFQNGYPSKLLMRSNSISIFDVLLHWVH